MSINIENYIIVAVTNVREKEEKEYLKMWEIPPLEWSYLGVDRNGYKLDKDINPSFLFINQAEWKNLGEGVISALNSWEKKVVIYTHIGNNGISCRRLKEGIDRSICFRFHHNDPISMRLKNFLQIIRKYPKRFREAFETLIAESLSGYNLHLLSIFLPLNIDMQALSIIHKEVEEKKSKSEDISDYLINTKEPEGMLQNQIKYENKLTEALQILTAIEGIKHIKHIQDLLEEKRDFLKILDETKKCVNGEISVTDAKAVIKGHLDPKFWNNVTTFHKWYSALASCLRS